ncbi:cyclin-dependent kinase regulatory subunit CKS1 [Strigomonas culicis]|uniref:Cyclin-dependent kinases regulatory subunit n=1 Tax=Strigomonas culicis TaxID=28005 RepID=S9V2J3_9TRYP|nr:cyclin-dependent kinase regulatory subunit CKS1 [Strigomonas culicis]EPY35264.1 cyclin-dependent kinase regulatory subunit CKS1 [Strigomonas culicis]|eukprot:EPY30380.1 cyclin-dependent kinase regulatory subunit CKS1 [Strigomonas culicis]
MPAHVDEDLFSMDTKRKMEVLAVIRKLSTKIMYSDKYYDDMFEYRHVIVPKDIAKFAPKNRLMTEAEWRELGVQQSHGWEHYMIHRPERHVLLFKRPITN